MEEGEVPPDQQPPEVDASMHPGLAALAALPALTSLASLNALNVGSSSAAQMDIDQSAAAPSRLAPETAVVPPAPEGTPSMGTGEQAFPFILPCAQRAIKAAVPLAVALLHTEFVVSFANAC